MNKKQFMRLGVIFIICLIIFKFFFNSFCFNPPEESPFVLRVCIVNNTKAFKLNALKAGYILLDVEEEKEIGEDIKVNEDIEISWKEAGIKFGGKTFNTGKVRVFSLQKKMFGVNGIFYRGELDIFRTDKGIEAVNRVELEEYLKGVVPHEMNHLWPFSALKAQAIVSRSFAVSEARRNKSKNYDVTNDTFSQVYGGLKGQRWRTSRAVLVTKGRILKSEGEILPAYFHSCCGGHTEDASRRWIKSNKALQGVKCSWCRWSPYFRWQTRLAVKVIAEKLNYKGYGIKRIDNIIPGTFDESGRLEYIRIKSRNKWFEIPAEDFCSAIGGRNLKSANFHIKRYPLFYLFSGYGWGHGVGMCQWGAFGLGLRRWSTERILSWYYPGSEIADKSS